MTARAVRCQGKGIASLRAQLANVTLVGACCRQGHDEDRTVAAKYERVTVRRELRVADEIGELRYSFRRRAFAGAPGERRFRRRSYRSSSKPSGRRARMTGRGDQRLTGKSVSTAALATSITITDSPRKLRLMVASSRLPSWLKAQRTDARAGKQRPSLAKVEIEQHDRIAAAIARDVGECVPVGRKCGARFRARHLASAGLPGRRLEVCRQRNPAAPKTKVRPSGESRGVCTARIPPDAGAATCAGAARSRTISLTLALEVDRSRRTGRQCHLIEAAAVAKHRGSRRWQRLRTGPGH